MKSSWISRGVTAAAALTALTLLSTTPASAASYWNSAVAPNATSVGTVVEQKVTVSKRTFTIQLRVGKYGSLSYFWARAPKNSNANGMDLFLSVYNASTRKWESRRKMISNTTYTDAHRSIHKYGYKACAKAPGLGGTAAVCTSARYV
ncbi:hypothetical protein [Nonomuraea gerenzanensis]|uniref:Secreted protein n=1 Tax=Nonomuraea gerenzanensis TaxID=93944 RepID=A0A1M4E4C6_9ACTN|nr:hypothetical protein [Nonomuraea gerenzanensis]UBU15852.1 hypothetical protein LCN96_12825 [Nonomuraea gerenzanensis]SBO93643.1 hypothetical protein BN4615_P3157 [Nonomuraea gerenzanensis]